jgi:hypothetical protein
MSVYNFSRSGSRPRRFPGVGREESACFVLTVVDLQFAEYVAGEADLVS